MMQLFVKPVMNSDSSRLCRSTGRGPPKSSKSEPHSGWDAKAWHAVTYTMDPKGPGSLGMLGDSTRASNEKSTTAVTTPVFCHKILLLAIGMYGEMYASLGPESVLSLEEDVSIAAATDRKLGNRAALWAAFT